MISITIQQFAEDINHYVKLALQGAIFIYPTDTIYGIGAIISPDTIKKINLIKQRQGEKHYSIIVPSYSWIEKHCDVSHNINQLRIKRTQQYGPITVLFPLKKKYISSDLTKNSSDSTIKPIIWHHPAPSSDITITFNPSLITSNKLLGIRHFPKTSSPLEGDCFKESRSLREGTKEGHYHTMQHFVTQLSQPFISTSANISGQPNITHPSQFSTLIQSIDNSQTIWKSLNILKSSEIIFIDAWPLTNRPSTIIDYQTGKAIPRT